MIPEQTLETYPVFGDNSTKVQPDAASYSEGFTPGDVLPAEWENWAWAKNTKGITDLNAGVNSMEKELINVVTAGGATPDQNTNNQVITAINYLIAQAKKEAILAAHPVGSLYWTNSAENPNVTFGGGTWERIKDKFIWAAGDADTIGNTGGSKTVTLATTQIPSHTHTFTGSAVTSAANNRGHTHSVTASGTVAVKTNPTFTGSAVTSGGSSAANTGSESSHTHGVGTYQTYWSMENKNRNNHLMSNAVEADIIKSSAISITYASIISNYTGSSHYTLPYKMEVTCKAGNSGSFTGNSAAGSSHSHTMAHTHSVTASGSISGGAYTFTGSAVTSGGESQNHTHSVTAAGSNSNTGGGQAHDNMPPYLIQYCWRRTA